MLFNETRTQTKIKAEQKFSLIKTGKDLRRNILFTKFVERFSYKSHETAKEGGRERNDRVRECTQCTDFFSSLSSCSPERFSVESFRHSANNKRCLFASIHLYFMKTYTFELHPLQAHFACFHQICGKTFTIWSCVKIFSQRPIRNSRQLKVCAFGGTFSPHVNHHSFTSNLCFDQSLFAVNLVMVENTSMIFRMCNECFAPKRIQHLQRNATQFPHTNTSTTFEHLNFDYQLAVRLDSK